MWIQSWIRFEARDERTSQMAVQGKHPEYPSKGRLGTPQQSTAPARRFLEPDMLKSWTLPNEMHGVPLGMAAMGALLIDVGGQLVQLNRAGATTAMDELNPVAPACGNAFRNGAVS